jgi:hypothetical protein
MHFTISVTTCSQAHEIFRFLRRCPYFAADPPGKSSHLALSPLGPVAGVGGANSGELVAGLVGEGRGKGLWATRVRFGSSVGGEKLPGGGAPAASGGSRRGPLRRADPFHSSLI